MDRVLLDLGVIQIYWYGAILFLAFLIGGYLVLKEATSRGMDEEQVVNIFFFLVPISLLGARLYYVAFNLDIYNWNIFSMLNIRDGGLAIHGGIIFGLLWILLYVKKNRIRPLIFMDMTVVGLVIGQAIGRWGNFVNQEAHGGEVSLEFLQKIKVPEFVINNMYINDILYHPTFLYESILCLLIFITLIIIRTFYKYLKIGHLTAIYLILYGIVRFFIESLRTDSLMLGNFRIAQIVSIIMIIIGIVIIIVKSRGSKFQNLYKGDI